MKHTIRITALIFTATLLCALFSSCSGSGSAQLIVRVGTLKGPTGMGMVGVMADNDEDGGENHYEFTLLGSADDMRAKVVSGDVDIAALPTNMASVLYNKDEGSVTLLAVNTLGVLYILENGEPVDSVSDLRGKTVYASGQGSAPEYVLDYILTQNGLTPGEDVEIEWLTEHSELAAKMISGDVTLGMLPEPFVTTTTAQEPAINVALDLSQEWDNASDGAYLAMGCIVVRTEFLEQHPEAVAGFLMDYEQSVRFVNRDIGDAAALMEHYDIIPAAVAEKAVPNCNIVYFAASDMRESIESFLEVLYTANPQSIGGGMPDDGFYYKS